MLSVLIQYHNLLLQGFLTTITLLGCIILIGILFGTIVGILGAAYSQIIKKIIKAARFLTKVIPILVLLFWLHYPLQALFGIVINPFWTTILALGIINVIATAHIITAELELLPLSYREAGKTLGLTKRHVIQHIELPLLARRALPQLLLNQASMLEYTLLASLISVPELFRTAQTINAMVYKPIEIYSLLVLFFFLILAPLHYTVSWLQKKYSIQYA